MRCLALPLLTHSNTHPTRLAPQGFHLGMLCSISHGSPALVRSFATARQLAIAIDDLAGLFPQRVRMQLNLELCHGFRVTCCIQSDLQQITARRHSFSLTIMDQKTYPARFLAAVKVELVAVCLCSLPSRRIETTCRKLVAVKAGSTLDLSETACEVAQM